MASAGRGRHLPANVEAPEQALSPQHGRKLWSDTDDFRQHNHFTCRLAFFGEHGIPFRLDCLDLIEQHFHSVDLPQNLTLHICGQIPSITGAKSFQPIATITLQRIVAGDALREEQTLDPVAVPDASFHQHLALPDDAAAILLIRARQA